jgi:hypothetical protein
VPPGKAGRLETPPGGGNRRAELPTADNSNHRAVVTYCDLEANANRRYARWLAVAGGLLAARRTGLSVRRVLPDRADVRAGRAAGNRWVRPAGLGEPGGDRPGYRRRIGVVDREAARNVHGGAGRSCAARYRSAAGSRCAPGTGGTRTHPRPGRWHETPGGTASRGVGTRRRRSRSPRRSGRAGRGRSDASRAPAGFAHHRARCRWAGRAPAVGGPWNAHSPRSRRPGRDSCPRCGTRHWPGRLRKPHHHPPADLHRGGPPARFDQLVVGRSERRGQTRSPERAAVEIVELYQRRLAGRVITSYPGRPSASPVSSRQAAAAPGSADGRITIPDERPGIRTTQSAAGAGSAASPLRRTICSCPATSGQRTLSAQRRSAWLRVGLQACRLQR